jgi:hypothetical protein
MGDKLRLKAADCEDLAVIAACLQDARVPLKEMAFLPGERRFVAAFTRYRREAAGRPGRLRGDHRVRLRPRLRRGDEVKYRGIDPADLDREFSLLTVATAPGRERLIHVDLVFEGDASIQLRIDRIAARLDDFGEPVLSKVTPCDHFATPLPGWTESYAAPPPLDAREPGFGAAFRELVDAGREERADVREVVAGIVAAVAAEGDAALVRFTARFDRLTLTADRLRVTPGEVAAARARCGREELAALEFAAGRVRAFHARQVPADLAYEDELGVRLGQRWRPLDAVGLYVPGGTAAYPSSVLMNAIPAKVAGVRRLVMVVPTPDGRAEPAGPGAAALAGVDEIYRVGGAQAVAALAYGTAAIARVDKVVGPATPTSPRRSGRCSAGSGSTWWPAPPRWWSWPTRVRRPPPGSRPTSWPRPSTTRWPSRCWSRTT